MVTGNLIAASILALFAVVMHDAAVAGAGIVFAICGLSYAVQESSKR